MKCSTKADNVPDNGLNVPDSGGTLTFDPNAAQPLMSAYIESMLHYATLGV